MSDIKCNKCKKEITEFFICNKCNEQFCEDCSVCCDRDECSYCDACNDEEYYERQEHFSDISKDTENRLNKIRSKKDKIIKFLNDDCSKNGNPQLISSYRIMYLKKCFAFLDLLDWDLSTVRSRIDNEALADKCEIMTKELHTFEHTLCMIKYDISEFKELLKQKQLYKLMEKLE